METIFWLLLKEGMFKMVRSYKKLFEILKNLRSVGDYKNYTGNMVYNVLGYPEHFPFDEYLISFCEIRAVYKVSQIYIFSYIFNLYEREILHTLRE